MSLDFEGKVAIVTGSGGGIGKGYALELGKRGAKVVVNDLGGAVDGSGGSLTAAETVVKEIQDNGGDAMANGANVCNQDEVKNMVEQAMEKWGRVDVLVNNAGILRDKSFAKMPWEDFVTVVNVHLLGSALCAHTVFPIMKEQEYGRIIMTSSSSGLFGNFGQTNYGAAKAGIAGFSRSLSMEMAKYKCTVNTISPGAATRLTIDLMKAAGRDVDPDDWSQGPQQIAPIIAWVCSDEASEITNQIFHVSSGTVGIMQQPAVIKSFKSDELWTMDQLNQVMPELVEAKKTHDKEVEEKGKPS